MGTVARTSGKMSKPAPAGNHVATCVGVIDLGTQFNQFDQTWKYKIMLQWELNDELMDDGRPFMVSRKLTLSLHEMSSLRKILESWRGRPFTDAEAQGFDVKAVLGAPCMLTVVHEEGSNGRTYANVTGVAALPKRIDKPEPVNPLRHYSIEDGDPEVAGLPEWLCKVVRQSQEFTGGNGAHTASASQPVHPNPSAVASHNADLERDPAPF